MDIRKLCVLVCPLLAVSTPPIRAESPTASDFFRDLRYEEIVISPDGRHLAATYRRDGTSNLAVIDLDNMVGRPLTGLDTGELDWISWAGPRALVYGYRQRFGIGWASYIAATDVDGQNNRVIGGADGGLGCRQRWYINEWIIHMLPQDPQHVLIVSDCAPRRYRAVYRVDIQTAKRTNIAALKELGDDYVADQDGNVRLALNYAADLTYEVYYRRGAGDDWRLLRKLSFGEQFVPYGFADDNRTVYVVSNLDRDRAALFTFDPEERRFGQLLFEHPDVDVGRPVFTHDRKELIGVTFITDGPYIHYFDEDAREVHDGLSKVFPEGPVTLLNHTDDRRYYVVEASSDRHPGVFYLYDRERRRVSELANSAPWIDPAAMPATTPVSFHSRDGTRLHGYLTRPRGPADNPLPLVVIPHGGPFGIRDVLGFDPQAKFLATRGYAVLKINFRGSGGYGRAFIEAGYRQWGLLMQDDITDGVQWAVAEGIADPTRICIFGASYGGYAAMMGLVRTPELYRCAVTYAGVSDLPLLYAGVGGWRRDFENYMSLVMGKRTDAATLKDLSPIHHADKIKAPVFIAHGKQDPVADFQHAMQLKRALDRHDVPYELLVKGDEGHGFSRLENKIEFYDRLAAFLDKHIGLGAAPTGKRTVEAPTSD